jgi:hypothetical protein
VADGGDARPESTRERGLPVAGGGGPGAGSSGEAWALERRSWRGVGTGGRVEQRERLGGSATEGKEEGKGGGPRHGGATRRGGAMGPGLDRRTAPGSGPSAALVGNVRHARVLAGQSGGERRLMGGPRHSVGRWCR